MVAAAVMVSDDAVHPPASWQVMRQSAPAAEAGPAGTVGMIQFLMAGFYQGSSFSKATHPD